MLVCQEFSIEKIKPETVFHKMRFQECISQIRAWFLSVWNGPLVSFLRQSCSLRWWRARSWRFRVQFLVGLVSAILLVFSGLVWWNCEAEHARLSSKFMRLQLFGPQEILFYSEPEAETGAETGAGSEARPETKTEVRPENASGKSLGENGNFCRFHIETRQPYGKALPNVRLEATLQRPNGTPFWIYSDQTGADGTFRLPFPKMHLPERMELRISAADGDKKTEFRAMLRARELGVSERFGLWDPRKVFSDLEPEFHDETLTSIRLRDEAPQPELSGRPAASMSVEERILGGDLLDVTVSSGQEKFHPVFLGVWQGDVLLACRPVAAGKRARKVALELPKNIYGPLTVLLADYEVSPPQVIQKELVWRPAPADAEIQIPRLGKLHEFAERMHTPEFREKEQALAYLPMDLKNPEEPKLAEELLQTGKFRVEDPENFFDLLEAADRLLASSLTEEISEKDAFSAFELEKFHAVLNFLDPLAFSISGIEEPDREETGAASRTFRSLMEDALALQSWILEKARRESTAETAGKNAFLKHLPVVFDSLPELEKNYREETEKFRNVTLVRVKARAFLLLVSAAGLLVLGLVSAFLGVLPDWRIRSLALASVFAAGALSMSIQGRSDVERFPENVQYTRFTGILEEFQGETESVPNLVPGTESSAGTAH